MASDGADICVIAGTGSIVCSRNNGKLAKSGGGGFILGDQGSAFQYGRAAMRHFLDVGAAGASEALRKAIEDRFGSLEENEVLARLYRGGLPAAQLAKLATAFSKDVRNNEPYALQVLEEQTIGLALIVKQHVGKHFAKCPELTVSLAGGLWEGSTVYRNAFEAELREIMPEVALTLMRISRPPVQGAVQLARELAS
jgi:N-acetylglucosamine kinase-like BadF-type ATPase